MTSFRLHGILNILPIIRALNVVLVLGLFPIGGWAIADEISPASIPESHQLSLKGMNGYDHYLHDYMNEDKWLVVMIWQSDCHVCNQEAAAYTAWYEKNKSGNSTLLGVSTDGWEHKDAAQGFLDKHHVTFPSVLVSTEVLNNYYEKNVGASFFGTPSFLIYSPAGELLAAQVGAVPTEVIDNFIQDNSKLAAAAIVNQPRL